VTDSTWSVLRGRTSVALLVGLSLLATLVPGPALAAEPRLVLFIVVDQLRGDQPLQLADRFGEGGFRHLTERGLVYTNARYRHSTTFTAAGHATLATGGHAAQHGLVGNSWHDRVTGAFVYCVEDPRHQVLEGKPRAHDGTSPRNLTSSTFGDELVMANDGASRAFAVSIKDRAAILLAGHVGKAFWYAASSGHFVTSSYYYDAQPAWAKKWNEASHADRFGDQSWTLLQPRERYRRIDSDDRPFEKPQSGMGRTFPHPLGSAGTRELYSRIKLTPMGDELTVDFTIELMKREKIGQGRAADYLAVSLSVTDYVGHAFGPHSLEQEDNLLRLDRSIARLLRHVDESVGLENTLVVLTSDHGVDEAPEFKASLGMHAGRLDSKRFIASANEGLRLRFDIDDDLVTSYSNPSLYLDLAAVRKHGLDVAEVERALAAEMRAQEGFAAAFTRTNLLTGNLPDSKLSRRIQNAFHPVRSGNVVIVQSPNWYLHSSPDRFAAMHGSPHVYDTYVPIMIAGPGIENATIVRPVKPADIAPTLSLYLGIKPPSGSIGGLLSEALDDE